MKTLKFEVTINASSEKVWEALWEDKNYSQWTIPFGEGCYAESDWEEGSSIKFLGSTGEGMFSTIKTKIPNQKITFKHLGTVKDGVQKTETEWANAIEEYILEENDGKTNLRVSVDVVEKYEDMFKKSFHEALKIIKNLSEIKVMLQNSETFSSYSIDDIEEAKDFYTNVLDLKVKSNPMGFIELYFQNGNNIILYPKPNHEPATFTVLNFPVKQIEKTVDALLERGVKFIQYEAPIKTDEKGICWNSDGPNIAWFKDPAGNILSILEE